MNTELRLHTMAQRRTSMRFFRLAARKCSVRETLIRALPDEHAAVIVSRAGRMMKRSGADWTGTKGADSGGDRRSGSRSKMNATAWRARSLRLPLPLPISYSMPVVVVAVVVVGHQRPAIFATLPRWRRPPCHIMAA